MVRKKIIFYGRVQGVGFRYHAKNASDSLGLTGWVRNEYDGSVMMEVQGDEADIERMLQMLHSDMYIEILDMDIKTITVIQNERGFRISC